MFVMVERVIIEGYGIPDLIERVENQVWISCGNGGANFKAIMFGVMVLTRPPDSICPTRFRVTLVLLPCGRTFNVEGFQTQTFCTSIIVSMNDPFFKITIDGCEICDLTIDDLHKEDNKHLIPYRLIVERI